MQNINPLGHHRVIHFNAFTIFLFSNFCHVPFFFKSCFAPDLHNVVIMLSTFPPSPCYSERSNYFLMLLSSLKLHGKVSGLITSNSMKQ